MGTLSNDALNKLPVSPTRPDIAPNRLNTGGVTGSAAAIRMARKESTDAKRQGSETPTFDSKKGRARSASLSSGSKPDTATSAGPPRSTLSSGSNASNMALPLPEPTSSPTSAAARMMAAAAQKGASSTPSNASAQAPTDMIDDKWHGAA